MVLICNQPAEAEKVLDALRFTPSKASQRRLKRMHPRGKALKWSKLATEQQYQQAQTLVRSVMA